MFVGLWIRLSKIIQSSGFLGALLGKSARSMMKVTVPLTKNVLLPLATMASASAIIGAIQIKMCGRGVIRAGKIIILVISCYDIIRIIKSLQSLENHHQVY